MRGAAGAVDDRVGDGAVEGEQSGGIAVPVVEHELPPSARDVSDDVADHGAWRCPTSTVWA